MADNLDNVKGPSNKPIRNTTHKQRKIRVDNARRHANGENYDADGKKILRGYQKKHQSRLHWFSRRYKTEEDKNDAIFKTFCLGVYNEGRMYTQQRL